MKTLASTLGILTLMAFMTACGPDMNAINQSTQTAESASTRAQAAAQSADQAANQASAAAQQADQAAAGAQSSADRAKNTVEALKNFFASTVTK